MQKDAPRSHDIPQERKNERVSYCDNFFSLPYTNVQYGFQQNAMKGQDGDAEGHEAMYVNPRVKQGRGTNNNVVWRDR